MASMWSKLQLTCASACHPQACQVALINGGAGCRGGPICSCIIAQPVTQQQPVLVMLGQEIGTEQAFWLFASSLGACSIACTVLHVIHIYVCKLQVNSSGLAALQRRYDSLSSVRRLPNSPTG